MLCSKKHNSENSWIIDMKEFGLLRSTFFLAEGEEGYEFYTLSLVDALWF